jgi:subtilisin family serine protease
MRQWAQEQRLARRTAAEGFDAADVLAAYERDGDGQWFKRNEIVVAGVDAAIMATAASMGLTERRRTTLSYVGLDLVTFETPPGMDARAAVQALQARHPGTLTGLNYLYIQQGRGELSAAPLPPQQSVSRATVAIIDGPVPTESEQFAGARFATRRFVAGPLSPARHGAAVAEILRRSAAAAELRMIAADVVSAGPIESAAAEDIARALDWSASESAGVINVSLTGPPHPVLALISHALAARGHVIVAAAGNAGPRAPAPYPAALEGVIGVTAVDRRGRLWRRATRGAHVDFAALGVDVAADDGARFSGTSYAAPVVSGVLARLLPAPDPARREQALEQLAARARPLGAPAAFGRGLIEAN